MLVTSYPVIDGVDIVRRRAASRKMDEAVVVVRRRRLSRRAPISLSPSQIILLCPATLPFVANLITADSFDPAVVSRLCNTLSVPLSKNKGQ